MARSVLRNRRVSPRRNRDSVDVLVYVLWTAVLLGLIALASEYLMVAAAAVP